MLLIDIHVHCSFVLFIHPSHLISSSRSLPPPLPLLPPPPLSFVCCTRVIVEAECVLDWNSKVTEIKRSFMQLKDTLHTERGESKTLVWHVH